MSEAWALKNGVVIDGTGKPGIRADVLIRDARVEFVGPLPANVEARGIDCSGLTVAPGFIDAHTHSDLQVLEGRRDKTIQGVTTEVIGNCGFSAYPPARDPEELRRFANGIFCGGDEWGWPSSEAYLRAIERCATVNAVSLVGHGTLRIAVAGTRQGRLSGDEVDRMCGLLDEAFAAGATGFSTGLMYAPGSSAPTDELQALCRVVAKHGKVYTTHMRSYFAELVPAIDEQVELARRAECRLQISHLQAVGAANWPEHRKALDAIEKAAADGVDIAFDCYPYVAGSSVLTQLLPQWVLDGGTDAMLARLTGEDERRGIADEIVGSIAWRWRDVYISAVGSSVNAQAVGRNLEDIAEQRGCDGVDALIDLLIEERGDVNMLSFNQSEDNLRLSLTHPLAIVISDGFYVRGRPHPRLHGTFPLLLGTMSRKRGWLSIEEAVHKITQRPAERFHMNGRGTITPGAWADVTVFDASTVDSPATYEQPELPAVGIRHVFRNGQLLWGGPSH
jgi:dihydroorotase/N-acyl-D-amino-acid deacylase